MVIYRPQTGTLVEAMREAKEFKDFEEMKKHIVEQANADGKDMLSMDDVVINPATMRDSRCGWWDAMYVCVKRYGKEDYEDYIEKYNAPQGIVIYATLYASYCKDYCGIHRK